MGKFIVIAALIGLVWFAYDAGTRKCWDTADVERSVTNRLGTYLTAYTRNDEFCLWVRTWSLTEPCGTTGCFSR